MPVSYTHLDVYKRQLCSSALFAAVVAAFASFVACTALAVADVALEVASAARLVA